MKEKVRCPWPTQNDPLYIRYHDKEWGVPVRNDQKLYEFLVLEAFQAGLSWATVLRKRENFRKAFAQFDPVRVAKFSKRDIERLMKDAGIIRNRAKIEAAINNAQRFLEIQREFKTFSKYQWQFVGGKPIIHRIHKSSDYPVTIKEAEIMAKDMKQRGFKFLGPVVLYAHMQAVGMVNDHVVSCFRHKELKNK